MKSFISFALSVILIIGLLISAPGTVSGETLHPNVSLLTREGIIASGIIFGRFGNAMHIARAYLDEKYPGRKIESIIDLSGAFVENLGIYNLRTY